MSRKKNLRAWARLRVLCCSGLSPLALAPDAFAVMRDLVPNAAAALFLTSPEGVPQAFFHEDSPAAVQQLFLQEPALFSGPDEYNVFRLVGDPRGAKIGQLIDPPPGYWRSNTFQLLVRASGHQHSLDARLEVDGVRRGMLSLFREPGAGFADDDRQDMARIALHLEHALKTAASAPIPVAGLPEGEAMLVCTPAGQQLYASPQATELLQQLPLAGADWPDRRQLPTFCLRLLAKLRDAQAHPWELPCETAVLPGGQLQATAQWLGAVDAATTGQPGLVGIVLKRLTPRALRVWRRVGGSSLSPQEMEVAYWLAVGGSRDAVRERMPTISDAVLRDCVKAVYAEFGCSSQADLLAAL